MEMTPIETMGGRETNPVYFHDCEVPAENLLGELDRGWTQLMAGLNTERLILAATTLGTGQRAFDDALAYAKERKQFGCPIGSFQALQHRFAELATMRPTPKSPLCRDDQAGDPFPGRLAQGDRCGRSQAARPDPRPVGGRRAARPPPR
jgi:hypothetical protein